MPVYVDKENIPYGRMIMNHMLADSLEELHAMADKIGIQRKWFQHKPGKTPHYDIALSKKQLALASGAIEIDRRKTVKIMNFWKDKQLKEGEKKF